MFALYSFLVSLLLSGAAISPLNAQLLHLDDFSDGNANDWLVEDLNDPSFGPGLFDASSDAYVLSVTGEMPAGFTGFPRLTRNVGADGRTAA